MVTQGVKSGLLVGFGACSVIFGVVLAIMWPSLFFTQLQKRMALTPDSMSFSIWKETPIPMYLECFMFNISNVDDILSGRARKVEVTEMGPYMFRETHSKIRLIWNLNSTVTFYNQRWWHFDPDLSNGSLSDLVTTINPVIATVAHTMRNSPTYMNVFVDAFLATYHDNLFQTANVSQWLFDGVDDPVLDFAERIPFLPIEIPFDKFGWFYMRNGSSEYDGIFLMNTGVEDFSQLGNIEKWRNSNRTVYRDECGEVRGSTGELWAPELGQPEVSIFAPDICTYIILASDGPVTVEGLEGVQYSSNDSVFDNGYNYPRTACYCSEKRDADCLPSGALNVSSCRYGAPAFVTLPHFEGTDPYYPSKIDGLVPGPEYNFRLALEMFTGMPLSVTAQLQINLLVRRVPGITLNNILPDQDTLVPMFWFRQEMTTTPEYAALARNALLLRYWIPYGFYAATAIGGVLLIWGVYILTKRILSSPDTSPILDNMEEQQVEQ